MNHHHQLMKQQDKQLDELLKVVIRQKEIAKTIESELSSQNKLIDNLKEDVEITQIKLNSSQKKLDKITGRTWVEWVKSWFK
jgi:regulator of vacuolar morphogenesis